MRHQTARYACGAFAVFVSFLLPANAPAAATSSQASSRELAPYVIKYATLSISEAQRSRLARYDHFIEHFSSLSFFRPRHRVNPNFVRALILAESDCDPLAFSSKRARGLTQILYETGRNAASEILAQPQHFQHVDRRRLQELREEDLHDPAINILIACYLVSKYNHLYDGRLDLVVSAWNAGEHAIQQHQPPPYEETRELIGKINGFFTALLKQRELNATRRPDYSRQSPGQRRGG